MAPSGGGTPLVGVTSASCVDEVYAKVAGAWPYVNHAIAGHGRVDVSASAQHAGEDAMTFFRARTPADAVLCAA